MSQTVDLTIDLAVDPQVYRAIQLNYTAHHRGGIVVLINNTIRVETAELIRTTEDDNFIQGIVVEDREVREMVFWYCDPTVPTAISLWGLYGHNTSAEDTIYLRRDHKEVTVGVQCPSHDG